MTQPSYRFKIITAYPNQATAKIRSRVESNQQLLQKVRNSLPENLAHQAASCLLKDNTLIIYAHSSAWATRLRFHANLIHDFLRRQSYNKIQTIKIRVLSPQTPERYAAKHPVTPSVQGIAAVKDSIRGNANADDKLNVSLLKLHETLKKLALRKC